MVRHPDMLSVLCALSILWSSKCNLSVSAFKSSEAFPTRSNKQLKFGDRLLPRLKTEDISESGISGGIVSDTVNKVNYSGHPRRIYIPIPIIDKDDKLNKEGMLDNVQEQEHSVIKLPLLFEKNQQINDKNQNMQNVYNVEDQHLRLSKADRLVDLSTEYFVFPVSSTVAPAIHLIPTDLIIRHPIQSTTKRPKYFFRKDYWVGLVFASASVTVIMIGTFEAFAIRKAWQSCPSRRHFFLEQMLIFGLFSCAILGILVNLSPNVLSCATIRFGAGIAYALVFSVLLVKCVLLISLNTGVYISGSYLALLLLFAVLIQVAIGVQWLMIHPSYLKYMTYAFQDNKKYTEPTNQLLGLNQLDFAIALRLCKTPFTELLLSMIYVMFLITFVTVLAIKSRKIRDNCNEAVYIGIAVIAAIIVWISWTICGLVLTDQYKDACLAFGLIATSTVVFLIMFVLKERHLPKIILNKISSEKTKQFNSLEDVASKYHSVFFHFKPIKYGLMAGSLSKSTGSESSATLKY